MRPELTIAGKEFRDHLTSKRFIAIFIVLMLLSTMSIVMGMDQYNKYLDEYKKYQADGGPSGMSVSPTMPSALLFFGGATNSSDLGGGFFSIILLLLSMALGFDLISREKEEGSLKSLLSHPVYRDAVINGKLLGAAATLAVVMGCAFLITVAVMLFYGVVPNAEELLRLITYFVMAMLYGGIFFSVSIFFSTVSRTSTMSVLCSLAVIIVFVLLTTFTPKIADVAMGPAPEIYRVPGGNNTAINSTSPLLDPAVQEYYYNRWKIIDTLNTISPVYDFGNCISPALLYRQAGTTTNLFSYAPASTKNIVYSEPSLLESLGYVWVKILALLVELAVPVALTYTMFMRMDVR